MAVAKKNEELSLVELQEKLHKLEAESNEILALITEKQRAGKAEALQKLKEQASQLGFSFDELAKEATEKTQIYKYKNPNGPEVWSGKGKGGPPWFKAALSVGLTIEDLISPEYKAAYPDWQSKIKKKA